MEEVTERQWDDDEKDVLRENTAQTIQEQLEKQDNLRTRYERRWIWELFQNALDASSGIADPLRIELLFDDDAFTFSHNGAPFARREILHLIFHGSTKRESSAAVGRYGTGFLTTHVLSRIVRVSGLLQTGQHFDFTLDRTGTTADDLRRAMEASRVQLLASLSAESGSSATRFTYPLHTNDTHNLVQNTLSDLTTIATAVIAFNPKIQSIALRGKTEASHELIQEEQLTDDCFLLRIGDSQDKTEPRTVAVLRSNDLALLLFLNDQDGNFSIGPPANVPRIFVAFPLFGTESLPFPFVINAPGAIPTDERDGLFLGSNIEREANARNKSLLESAWGAYQRFIDVAAARHWGRLHELARIAPSDRFEWLDIEWLHATLRSNALHLISSHSLVETTSCGLRPPSESIFPLGVPESQFHQFHMLVEQLYGALTVRFDVAGPWKENIERWHALTFDFAVSQITPGVLVQKVAAIGSLQALAKALPPEPDAVVWLNAFLQLLVECRENWADKNVLPDQTGRLSPRKLLLSDKGIDEELKDIAELFEVGIRNQLLDRRVTETIQGLLSAYDQDKALALLLNTVRTRKSTNYDTANARLLRWLIRNRRASDIKTYPFLMRASDANGLSTIAVISGIILAPPETWPTTAQPFADLFPSDHILASTYAGLLEPNDWQYLQEQAFCVTDPLVRESQVLDSDKISSMAQDLQALEIGEHTLPPLLVSDVPFLIKERGVLDTARASKSKGALVLAFFFNHVVPKSGTALAFRAVPCGCGKTHQLHTASWVAPLRERKWIYESKGHAAHVSPASLARLLKEDPKLLPRLADDAILTFLARLGISPSELHRATLDLPPDEIAKLDKAVLELLAASNNDPQSLHEIAELLSSAPEMLEEFQERKRKRERICKNQQLGSLVEQLFNELFSAPEIAALGLRLRRTGVGSDFAFESDFIEEGEEQWFAITTTKRQLLIEVKSTLASSAKMTPTQAKKATANPEAFILCVVPLEDRNPTLNLVRTNSRFVSNIGISLKEKVSQVAQFETQKALATTIADGIQVFIDDGDLRYQIHEPVWEAGADLTHFVQYLITFFSATDAANAS